MSEHTHVIDIIDVTPIEHSSHRIGPASRSGQSSAKAPSGWDASRPRTGSAADRVGRFAWSPLTALGGIALIAVGLALIALGIPMLILPGPGLLSIAVGVLFVARGLAKIRQRATQR